MLELHSPSHAETRQAELGPGEAMQVRGHTRFRRCMATGYSNGSGAVWCCVERPPKWRVDAPEMDAVDVSKS